MDKYSHNYGEYEAEKNIPMVVSNIESTIQKNEDADTDEVKSALEDFFHSWDKKGKVIEDLSLLFEYRNGQIQVETQFGNIARYYADILKIETAHKNGVIEYGILILPTKERSKDIGTNVANFDRAVQELKEMRDTITCPMIVYGI